MESFRAFVAEKADGSVQRGVRELGPDQLPSGEVTIRVAWSGVNYKDALATIPKGQVAQISPLVPGIDLAGEVVESDSEEVEAGQDVLVHGYGLGVSHHGGYAEHARVPADWVVPLPAGLDRREVMILGTAGFTAALSVQLLEQWGLEPGDGPVLVVGATGGVGSSAVAMLARRGYEVVASSGKREGDWLRELGAAEVLPREETATPGKRPLERQRWAAAVDPVGGSTLGYILPTLRYGGAVASSGLTAGIELETTVMPFILRGVALIGANSVDTPMSLRRRVWERLGDDLRPPDLEALVAREIGLDELEGALDAVLAGEVRGRALVRLGG